MRIPRSIPMAVAAVSLAGAGVFMCGGGATAGGGGCHEPPTDDRGTTVDLKNNCMLPTVLRIDAGQTVEFTNYDVQLHTVTGVGLATGDGFGSYDELAQSDTLTHVFDDEGTFVYYCILHPGMVGAIVVGDSAGADSLDESVSRIGGGSNGSDASPDTASAADDASSNTSSMLITGASIVALAAIGGGTMVYVRSRRHANA